jgi:hypothetical protein
MHWPTVKWVLYRLVPGFAVEIVAVWLFGKRYAPSPIVQEYLYSSVFQGLAALVAVTLAVTLYISDRLERAMEVHLKDARMRFDQFYPVTPIERDSLGYPMMVEGLKAWFADRVDPIQSALEKGFAPYRQVHGGKGKDTNLRADSPELKPLVDNLLRAESYSNQLEIYDDAKSHLARYKRARDGWLKLPKDALLAFGWSLTTIMLAVFLLATVDSPIWSAPSWAIIVVMTTILATIYMTLLFATLFAAFFGDDRIEGSGETGLRPAKPLWGLCYDVKRFLKESTDFRLAQS